MADAVEKAGTFFQMGFMRRFDAGYAAAKKQIDAGRIGQPLVFKATSRDPFRPSLEYANPASSGGLLIDMGIHDFDLARWFMGDVRSISAIGATLLGRWPVLPGKAVAVSVIEPMLFMWWLRPDSSAVRVGAHKAVVWKWL